MYSKEDIATTHFYQRLYSMSFWIVHTCSIFNAYTSYPNGWPFYCSATPYTDDQFVRDTMNFYVYRTQYTETKNGVQHGYGFCRIFVRRIGDFRK